MVPQVEKEYELKTCLDVVFRYVNMNNVLTGRPLPLLRALINDTELLQ